MAQRGGVNSSRSPRGGHEQPAYIGLHDPAESSPHPPPAPSFGEATVSSSEARYAMATVTTVRIARARVYLRLAEAVAKWRLNARAMLLAKPVDGEGDSMAGSFQPCPAGYVPWPQASGRGQAPQHSGEAVHRLGVSLLRGELQDAEASWAAAQSDVRSATGGGRGSPGASPAACRRSDVCSPTPTELSESGTMGTATPARSGRGAGLSLKQLSEGNRALNAALERELRRAADLAKVKQRYERSETRCSRAQQALQGALAEVEELRAEVARLKSVAS